MSYHCPCCGEPVYSGYRPAWSFVVFVAIFVTLLVLALPLRAQYPSEQLHIPYVVHSAPYFTDLTLTNLTTDRVSISYTFRSANSHDADPNAPQELRRADVRYLNPRQSLTVEVGEIGISGQGQLVVHACKEFIPCGDIIDQTSDPTNPRVLQNFNPAAIRKVSASVRIYSMSASGGTRGDSMAAIPWYALPGLDGAPGMDHVQIVGIRSDGHYTTQIGLNNASSYSSTMLTVILHDGSGAERGRRWTETLGPFESVKRSAEGMFGADAFAANRLNRTAATQSAWVEVQQTVVTPNELAARTVGCESGCPRFYAWASVTDSKSLDFSIVASSFEMVAGGTNGQDSGSLRVRSSEVVTSELADDKQNRLRKTGLQVPQNSAASQVASRCSIVGPFRPDSAHKGQQWFRLMRNGATVLDVSTGELKLARAWVAACNGGGQ